MNILTDILSLFKRQKFEEHVDPDDVIVIGISEPTDIEGVASPVPYKDVKLVKYKDFLETTNCDNVNVPLLDSNAAVFKDKTTDPITEECTNNFRRLKSLSLNLTINENGDFVEFNNLAEANTASNTGGEVEVFKEKIGEDLIFRTLTSADGSVVITQDTNVIDFSSTTGAQGVQGIQGTQGIQGLQGLDGAFAAQGIQGTQGIQGLEGAQGITGLQGTQGVQGYIGPIGDTGDAGAQGIQGLQGIVGIQGITGFGIQGTQGVQGSIGTQGTDGTDRKSVV